MLGPAHYLTEIRWLHPRRFFTEHRLPGWVAAGAVAPYVWDYAIGLRWLYCLSFLHVLLEIPLNPLTFAAIGRQLFIRRPGSPAPAVPA